MGWIRSVGVLPPARGRGLGGFLLPHAFAAFAARGRDTVGLGVGTENTTGAPRLYARHGPTVHYAVDTWETVVKCPPCTVRTTDSASTGPESARPAVA